MPERKRQMDIIHTLLNQDDYITIRELSQQLNVSGKTIRNDLSDIALWLSENQLTLVKKTGVGILVTGSQAQKLATLNQLPAPAGQTSGYSPHARQIYIALRLITCEDNCRIYELAKELYVSRATIHKDISSLSSLFHSYHITLLRKNNTGIRLSGKERSLRDAMLHLLEQDPGYPEFIKLVQESDYCCKDTFPFAALDYTDKDIFRFVRLLLDSGNPFLLSLPLPALLNMILRLFICLIRILDNHFVSLSEPFLKELALRPLYMEACSIGTLLEETYNVTISPTELRYMQIHFLSLKNQTETQAAEHREAAELAERLLLSWEQALHCPFSRDKELLASLTAHLEPAVTRLHHGIPIENPMMYEIHRYYQNTFSIVKKSIGFIEERYHCTLSDEEIGYLTIYLATALEHRKQPLSTILVSHGGKGAGRLLLDKLTCQVPEIQITSVESFLSIQNANLAKTDLILSTVPLPFETAPPVIQITPLLSNRDILHLKEVISSYYNKKNDPLSLKGSDNVE